MKHLAVAFTAALMLCTIGAGAAAAEDGGHRVDRHMHQHQGIGGPTTHHHGTNRH
ncbi:MAG TPA: hypothetical protein VJL81_16940 [Solirubrobacterales bacterium]|nr:hypothetical protein [Solirubrobacterales bacterium]